MAASPLALAFVPQAVEFRQSPLSVAPAVVKPPPCSTMHDGRARGPSRHTRSAKPRRSLSPEKPDWKRRTAPPPDPLPPDLDALSSTRLPAAGTRRHDRLPPDARQQAPHRNPLESVDISFGHRKRAPKMKTSTIPELLVDLYEAFPCDINRLPPLLRHKMGLNWLFLRHVAKTSRSGKLISWPKRATVSASGLTLLFANVALVFIGENLHRRWFAVI